MTVTAEEFLRRFLLHTLPRGFVRIRFCGFLANRRRRELLPLCRQLLEPCPWPLRQRPTTPSPNFMPLALSALRWQQWHSSKSSPLNRSVADLSSGRASLTLHSRHSSANHGLLRHARRTCVRHLEQRQSDTKLHSRKAQATPLYGSPHPSESNSRLSPSPARHHRGAQRRLNTHSLPRPPQTRAASFKRLYPK